MTLKIVQAIWLSGFFRKTEKFTQLEVPETDIMKNSVFKEQMILESNPNFSGFYLD